VRHALRVKHYKYATEREYLRRIREFIIFLYREVLQIDVGDFKDGIVWTKKPEKLPEVFTPAEVQAVLSHLDGVYWLMGMLMYGAAGLRLIECLRLRVKDIDYTYKKITVREGKGAKDRSAMLPEIIIPALQKAVKTAIKKAKIHKHAGCQPVGC
jgi:integrase